MLIKKNKDFKINIVQKAKLILRKFLVALRCYKGNGYIIRIIGYMISVMEKLKSKITPKLFYGHLDFITQYKVKELTSKSLHYDPKQLNIHIIIPDFERGAGGHMTIFRIVKCLKISGKFLTTAS